MNDGSSIMFEEDISTKNIQDVQWLKEAIEEKMNRIIRHHKKENKYEYEAIDLNKEKIIFFPTIPHQVIRKNSQLNIEIIIEGRKKNFKLTQLEDQRGYKVNYLGKAPDVLPKVGVCKILTKKLSNDLKEYLQRKKEEFMGTINNFLESPNIASILWRYVILTSQQKIDHEIKLPKELSLKIIEGKAGTGKTEYIIKNLDIYKGKTGIIVYDKGALLTYKERLKKKNKLSDVFIFQRGLNNLIDDFRKTILENIENAKIEDPDVLAVQEEWKELLKKSAEKDLVSFLSLFSNAVLIKKHDVSFYKKIAGDLNFEVLFIDDSNQFHPWSIIEIFPLSKNIVITGDPNQLIADKDFEFIVHKLGLNEKKTIKTVRPKTENVRYIEKEMDINEELSFSYVTSEHIHEIAKAFMKGLSLPQIEKRYLKQINRDIRENLDNVSKIVERTLFSIIKNWNIEGIEKEKFNEIHRYTKEYEQLLRLLGILKKKDYDKNLDKKKEICEGIYLPLTFFDFPIANLEDRRYYDRSVFNLKEVEHIKKIVSQIIPCLKDYSLLITSGYGAQTNKLKESLRGLISNNKRIHILHIKEASSLEVDIVIVSLTRNNRNKNIGHLDKNMISTALTRAKKGVIIVGCSDTFIFNRKNGKKMTEQRMIIKKLKDTAKQLCTYNSIILGDVGE